MAREITIQNRRWFKKSLTISEIIGDNDYTYGFLDEHGRQGCDMEEAAIHVIYDNKAIGRGVQVEDFANRKSMTLSVNIPCTKEDVLVLFTLARRIAKIWGASNVMVDDEKVDVSEFDKYIEHDIADNVEQLKLNSQYDADNTCILLCAKYPLYFKFGQLVQYAEDYQSFCDYLNEKQQKDPFYPIGLYWGDEGDYTVNYCIIPDSDLVLPNKPQIDFVSNDVHRECHEANILAPGYIFDQEESVSIKFEDFMARVPETHKSEFDCEHTYFTSLSIEEMKRIFQD